MREVYISSSLKMQKAKRENRIFAKLAALVTKPWTTPFTTVGRAYYYHYDVRPVISAWIFLVICRATYDEIQVKTDGCMFVDQSLLTVTYDYNLQSTIKVCNSEWRN